MDTFISVLVIIGGVIALVLLAAAICLAIDRWTLGPPPTREQMEAFHQQHYRRLLSPQWSDLEARFGVPIPDVLRKLYDDHDRLLESRFYVVPPNPYDETEDWFIQEFEPADLETLRTGFPLIGCDEEPNVAKRRFAFASDDFGNSYFIELGPYSPVELPVFYYDHDGGSIDQIADSLAEFMNWERRREGSEC